MSCAHAASSSGRREHHTGARGARQLSWAGRDWRWLPRSDTRSTGGPWGTGSFPGQRSWRWLPRHRPSPSRHKRPASGASVRLTPPTLARVRAYLALSAAACASGTLASSVRTRLSSAAAAAAERPAADSASAAAAASDCPEGAVPTRGAAGGRRGRRRRRRHQARGAHTSAREARGQPPVAREQQQRSAQLAAPHHCSVRCWGLCASVRAGGTHLCVVVGPLERLAHGGVRHRA